MPPVPLIVVGDGRAARHEARQPVSLLWWCNQSPLARDRGIAGLRLHTTVRALVTRRTALVTLAFLPLSEPDAGGRDRGRGTASVREKRHGGTLGAAGAGQAHRRPSQHHAADSGPWVRTLTRVAVVFITPAWAAVAVAAAPQGAEIGGAAIVLPPLSGQTAFLDERARKAWSAVADRNADADFVVWEVVR